MWIVLNTCVRTVQPMKSNWWGGVVIRYLGEFFGEGNQSCFMSILISYRLLRDQETINSVLSWAKGTNLHESVSWGIVYIMWFFFQSNGTTEHQVESFIRKKLESLLRESQIRDKEDPDSFTVRALLKATHEGLNAHLKQVDDFLLNSPFNKETCTLLFSF